MNEKQYAHIVVQVLQGLKNECEKIEYCSESCNFYDKSISSCHLKKCPCDYYMPEIEKAVTELIRKEMQDEAIKG